MSDDLTATNDGSGVAVMCRPCGGEGEVAEGDGILTVDRVLRCRHCGGSGVQPSSQARLTIVPLTLRQSQAFVGEEHRHHPPTSAHKFSIGVEDEEGNLRGVAVAGRPVARMLSPYRVLEVLRVATDGCDNACSALYGAVARIAKEMGYERHNVITYTLASEPGTSLQAAGWWRDKDVVGQTWDRPNRKRTDKHPTGDKVRWRAAKPPHNGLSETPPEPEDNGSSGDPA